MTGKNIQTPVFVGVIVVVVVLLGFFLWKQTAGAPTPTLGPGQSIEHPFGNASPGRQAGNNAAAPTPGTASAGQGFGPSRNAPIPRQ